MSYTPPLAVPPHVQTPDSPIATLLGTLSNAEPNMPAEVAAAIARVPGQTVDNAVTSAQATQGFTVSSQQVQSLKDQSTANQQATWKGSTASQQEMLKAAGYQPPPTGGGWFHDVTSALGTGLHDTLNAAGAPLRAVQHGIRTVFAGANSDPNGSVGYSWMFSPSDWAKAWDQTSSGNRYILPSVERQVQQTYGDQTYRLALQLATGTDAGKLIASAPDQQSQDALAQQIQSDPRLHAAVQSLQDGKVTWGRMLARSLGITPEAHPQAFNAVSGIGDATIDWFGDPTVIGAKSAAGARAARFIVRDGTDVANLYRSSSSVQRAVQTIAGHLADHATGDTNAVAALQNAFPKLSPLIPDLVRSGATSADDVAKFMADSANVRRLVTYNPAQLPGLTGGGWMPTLSYAGQARLAAKGAFGKAIDYLADGPAKVDEPLQPGDLVDHPTSTIHGVLASLATKPGQGVGQFLKKVTTLTPPGEFDATDPHWLDHLRDIADMALPREQTNRYLSDMASAADLGGKRVIYTNLMKDLFARMGVGDTPYGQQWMRSFADDFSGSNPASLQKYAPGDIDMIDLGTGPKPTGIIEPHLTTKWQVPDYRVLYAQSKKLGITHAVMGVPNSDMVDRFMQQIWKPLSLARVGFALRVGSEEAFGQIVRNGPAAYLKAQAARSALKNAARADVESDMYEPTGRLWNMLTGHLPKKVVGGITGPADLVAAHLGDATHRAMANVAGRLAGSQYRDAIAEGYDHVFEPAFTDHVTAAHGRGGGYLDGDVLAQRIKIFDDGRWVPATFKKTGAFTEYKPEVGGLYAKMWHDSLGEIASSRWSRAALETADQPYPDRLKAVSDVLKADWKMASRSPLWDTTSDGRRVSEKEATRTEATTDWARRIVDNVDANVRAPHIGGEIGAHIPLGDSTVAQHLLDKGEPPSLARLEEVPEAHRPLSVKGPGMIPVLRGGTGFFTRGVAGMFDVIGKQINWISREPMFVHNYTVSRKALLPLAKKWEEQFGPRALTEVVDDAGKPLRVFHGTQDSFDKFDPNLGPRLNKDGRGAASYFTSDPSYANTYSTGMPGERLAKGAVPQTRIAYLDIRNPVRLGESIGAFSQKEIATWKAAGHDGVIYTEAGKPAYAVFSPSQVKNSADSLVTQGSRNIDQMLSQAARDRATEMTVPYIHNPQLRSQFAQITRNLMPFWFAQEQFYKRWARTMTYSPWSFRQAQLISQGVQHSGFVHKDPGTGQEYFVYPGASLVQDVLTRTLSAFGYNSFLPIEAGLRGQVNQASPGLQRLGLPSYGPLVVIPLNLVKQWMPELAPQVTAVEGSQAASTGFIRSLVPTTVVRIWQDATSSPSNSSQFASAMMQAIQYLEATGHGIGTVATNNLGSVNVDGVPPDVPGQKPGDYVTNAHNVRYVVQADGAWRRNDPSALAAYQQQVRNWTRIFMVTRTIFGFNTPASPENLFDPGHLNEDLSGLLKQLPLEDALAVFMKEHPNANAYTVFQTATQSGAPLPATADAMQFLDSNSKFMGDHPLAGAYFLPQVDSTGKFDLPAYEQQLTEQLRLRKTPTEFWKQISYSAAATTYFNAEDNKNRMLRAGSSGMTKAQIDQAWTNQSQQFLKANPLFAAQLGTTADTPGSLVGAESSQYSRGNLLDDLVNSLNDPGVPETQQTTDLRTLVNSYITLESLIAPYGAPGTPSVSASQRSSIELSYAGQVQQYVADHPGVKGLYLRLIRPTLSGVLSQEAAAGA